ncbi:hypothetical protein MsAg5_11600 [Methanosarcinaceae archaeon Ag5]|uniref:DUF7847 domain-containing protein n=1 Tax=Methanolapillus africanus TaxID=3028297 RepID=A0AAE4SFF6_9EURY|nr:hypothetical protein [Methanosarcinaceae archaeon Ag5]
MAEDSIDVLANGVRHFIKNPIMLAPFICLLIVFIILTIIEGAILSIYLSNYIGSLFQSTNDIYYSLIMLFIYAVVLLLTASFFGAGLTGMAKTAVATGKTSFSDMVTYGKKGFLKFFELSVVFVVLGLLALIFFIPLYLQLGSFTDLLTGYLLVDLATFLSKLGIAYMAFSAGVVLSVIYFLVLWIAFFYAYYAAIVDDLSFVNALKKSVSMLKNKKALGFVILLTLFIAVLIDGSSLFVWIFSFLGPLSVLGPYVYDILVMVILTFGYVCGARMYMTIEGQSVSDAKND